MRAGTRPEADEAGSGGRGGQAGQAGQAGHGGQAGPKSRPGDGGGSDAADPGPGTCTSDAGAVAESGLAVETAVDLDRSIEAGPAGRALPSGGNANAGTRRMPERTPDQPDNLLLDRLSLAETTSDHAVPRQPTSQNAPSPHLSADAGGSHMHAGTALPADDGMKLLRDKLHAIRELALSSEDKARRMHELMVADYERFRLDATPKALYAARGHGLDDKLAEPTVADLAPTFHREEEEETDYLGCQHYRRNVKALCGDCHGWHTCRHCHDEASDHALDRDKLRYMLCMLCGRVQPAAGTCAGCGEAAAAYYCDICKLWDNDTQHRIYHCADCGICRRGEGLGKDFVHCKRCNVCISIAHAQGHRCVERATECDCPICGEWMFTSNRMVVAVRCGHYMHRACHDELMQTSFKCPICSRSAVNMELQWRKLDDAIAQQPMPAQFEHTRAFITCNDCGERGETRFHWLGNKCTLCESYNTSQAKLINSPSERELAELAQMEGLPVVDGEVVAPVINADAEPVQQVAADATARSPSVAGSSTDDNAPSVVSVSDVETLPEDVGFWGEAVSPSWTASLPAVPRVSMPGMPHMPQLPQLPQMQLPQMQLPQMQLPQMQLPQMPHMQLPRLPRPPVVPRVSMPGIPQMPRIPRPRLLSMGMPRAVSPSTIWAASSPTLAGWNLPSPRFFRQFQRGGSQEQNVLQAQAADKTPVPAIGQGGHGAGRDYFETASASESASESDDDDDGETDGDDDDASIDELELFGHR